MYQFDFCLTLDGAINYFFDESSVEQFLKKIVIGAGALLADSHR